MERTSLEYYIASEVFPLEEGVDRFRDKEDEETPLKILTSGSHGITVMEADIATLCIGGISVNNNNEPAPENFIQSGDVLATPSSLNFGFSGVNPWRHIGNFPVGRARPKITPNPRIQHMSSLDFFIKL